MGTCFDILTKPIPLQQKHIDCFRTKVILGTHKKALVKKEEKTFDPYAQSQDSIIDVDDMDDVMEELPSKTHVFESNQVVLHKEMLQSNTSELRDLRFSNEFVDFGFTHHGTLSEDRQITLNNKFPFPVRVDWTLLPVIDKKTGKECKNPFNIKPAQVEVPANSNFVFAVDFAPYEPDGYFFQMA